MLVFYPPQPRVQYLHLFPERFLRAHAEIVVRYGGAAHQVEALGDGHHGQVDGDALLKRPHHLMVVDALGHHLHLHGVQARVEGPQLGHGELHSQSVLVMIPLRTQRVREPGRVSGAIQGCQ